MYKLAVFNEMLTVHNIALLNGLFSKNLTFLCCDDIVNTDLIYLPYFLFHWAKCYCQTAANRLASCA